jgi:tight adherence protein B
MIDLLPLLLVVALTASGVMAVFFIARDIRDRQQAAWRRRVLGDEESEPAGLLGYAAEPEKSPNWSGQLDRAFAQMVHETGLGWGPEQALGLMALLGVILAGLLLLWRGDLWLVAVGLVVGISLPLAVYVLLRQRWRQRLQDQLPDAFFLLARSLRAGETLEQAMDMVASHGTRPLAGEFRQAVERIKLGLTVPAALQGMARRLRLPDFNVFVTAVTLHRNIGGNLTMLLDRVAASTRDRNLFRGYVRAATALARITGIAVAAAAPLLFVGYALWQPEFVTRFTDSSGGVRALTAAAVLEVIGVVWLYLLLRFDY